MNRTFLVIALALSVSTASAQTAGQLDPGSESQVARNQAMLSRQMQDAAHNLSRGDRQSWLSSMTNLAKLRTKLAEAWQDMGLSPQGAKQVADAYDPELAARMHHASLHGKTDQEVAQMLQSAIEQRHFLSANQLLIDYQRDKLRIGADPAPSVNW